jgi:hypothetical protein
MTFYSYVFLIYAFWKQCKQKCPIQLILENAKKKENVGIVFDAYLFLRSLQ